MSEPSKPTTNNEVTAEQLAEVIVEFEQYRERLINEATTAAQKAKLSKKKMMENLEPELALIDTKLERLREQHTLLTSNN
jgi:uncharacterized protein involved in exopolysaccharide biosynthesis